MSYVGAVAVGSHHDALDSYQTAVSLAPARLIHRVELGRTLDRLGRKEQARRELEVSLPCHTRCTSIGCVCVFFYWSASMASICISGLSVQMLLCKTGQKDPTTHGFCQSRHQAFMQDICSACCQVALDLFEHEVVPAGCCMRKLYANS